VTGPTGSARPHALLDLKTLGHAEAEIVCTIGGSPIETDRARVQQMRCSVDRSRLAEGCARSCARTRTSSWSARSATSDRRWRCRPPSRTLVSPRCNQRFRQRDHAAARARVPAYLLNPTILGSWPAPGAHAVQALQGKATYETGGGRKGDSPVGGVRRGPGRRAPAHVYRPWLPRRPQHRLHGRSACNETCCFPRGEARSTPRRTSRRSGTSLQGRPGTAAHQRAR